MKNIIYHTINLVSSVIFLIFEIFMNRYNQMDIWMSILAGASILVSAFYFLYKLINSSKSKKEGE